MRIPYYFFLILAGIAHLAMGHVPTGVVLLIAGILPPVVSRIGRSLWGE